MRTVDIKPEVVVLSPHFGGNDYLPIRDIAGNQVLLQLSTSALLALSFRLCADQPAHTFGHTRRS